MASRTSVVNISGDFEETLIQLARHLGTSRLRRKLFSAVYGRGDRAKSKKELMAVAGIADKDSHSQQAQNELDHLAKHNLVVKIRSEMRLDDGSRNQYAKDATVRANKDRIIRFADDPRLIAKVATKRSPGINLQLPARKVTRAGLRKRKQLIALYLASNPDPEFPLRVDVEVRRVQDAIRSTKFRDNVKIEYRPAADLNSLIQGLNDVRPNVVHFSGHSDRNAFAGDNQDLKHPGYTEIPYQTLARALRAVDTPPKVVVLNSCESIAAHTMLLDAAGILIGMNAPVSDIAAATFAPHFYSALASGQSVSSAFEQGRLMVDQVSLREDETIELVHADGVDPRKVRLT